MGGKGYFELNGQQKGAIGEALFSVGQDVREILTSWIYHDLHQHKNLSPASPNRIRIMRCGRDSCQYHHCDPFEDAPGRFPDFHFHAHPTKPNGEDRKYRSPTIDYLLEVKTGSSAAISKSQKRVMKHVEETDDRVVPVRAQVDVSNLPEEYGVKFTRIHDRW